MVLGVIPARYGSTRLKAKALVKLGGKPMIFHVWDRARKARKLNRLCVATDHEEISSVVREFGAEAVMTSPELPSGTDRVWAAASQMPADTIVNIQGDEPLLIPSMIDLLVETLAGDPQADMATLRFPMKGPQGYNERNVVKVVADEKGWALYFSRSPIPAVKEGGGPPAVWHKHLGFYAYRRGVLERFCSWPPSALEKSEGLEQLRALEHGLKIKVADSPADTFAVDTATDADFVDRLLKQAG
ncbi:MAG: 3-deoxy-manno-octulosonate cytidylyltransferase [Candidatus Omnitrophica bacterium]|nr:3-deoxy-manno-octulosonate cytidylyltransferase [Candidatus Omnitrophota bacterium]